MGKKEIKINARRNFVKIIGGFVAGAFVGSKGLKLLKAEAEEPIKFPWPYKKLDPEEVAKTAHNLFISKADYEQLKAGGKVSGYNCAEAAFEAIMKASGCPLPTAIETPSGGGGQGFTCICGALEGCLDAIGVFQGRIVRGAPTKNIVNLTRQLMDWFTRSEGAPCCHVSVTNRARNEGWLGKNWGCPEQSYSCSLLTGRVVEKTIELLNAEADGKLVAYKLPEYTKGCVSCHNPMIGVSDCFACHNKKSHTNTPHTPVAESIQRSKQPNYFLDEKGYLSKK